MKNTSKITLCAITAALCAVVMLTSYFPYLTYAIPAIAGLLTMVPLIEVGSAWGFATYAVSGVLALIFGETQSSILYICLFGYYPVLKAVIERIRKPLPEWIIKLVVFNLSALTAYFVMSKLFLISFSDFGEFGIYGAIITLAICNIAFVFYDIAISRVAALYMYRLHEKIKKFIK